MKKRDWVGRYVRLLRDVENKAGTIFEAGSVMRVTRNFGGLHLENVVRCMCGQKRRDTVRGVAEIDVRLLSVEFVP